MRRLTKSFSYALKGILFAVRHERNFQIEVLVGVFIISAMLIFPLRGLERALIIFSVALVLALELANTALERVMDLLKPRVHPYVRIIKDMMAGAVLLTSLAAVAVGVAIFLPYVLALARF